MFLASNGIKWDPQRSTKKKTRRETEKRGETGNENTAKETVIKIVTKTRIKKGGEGKTAKEKRSHPAEDDERVEKKKLKEKSMMIYMNMLWRSRRGMIIATVCLICFW